MAKNVYFTQGTNNEQLLYEDIIIESLEIYGVELFYIPRTLIAKDEILGEDRLSQFNNSYPICAYFEQIDSFEGQSSYIQKFGLMVEQSATLVVARRAWEQAVGRYGTTILPNRPCEGDLVYFPLSKGLFEIKYVQHQDPFYQIGKLYVYKLQVELFQYASERINTGIEEIDVFETLKSFDETINSVDTPDNYGKNIPLDEIASEVIFDESNPFGSIPTNDYVTDYLIETGTTDYTDQSGLNDFNK